MCEVPSLYILRNSSPVHNDKVILEDNAFVLSKDIVSIWTKEYWAGVSSVQTAESLYRPLFLTTVSLASSYVNVLRILVMLSHVIIGLMVYVLARSALTAYYSDYAREQDFSTAAVETISLFGASIFCFHPANVEVTAQVIGLMETMPIICGLGGLLLFTRLPVMGVLLIGLAPGWKETGFVWLGLSILYFLWKKHFRASFFLGAILFSWLDARFLIYAAMLRTTTKPFYLLNPLVTMDVIDGLFSRVALLGHYVRLYFWPFALSSDYSLGTLPLPGYFLQVWVIIAMIFTVVMLMFFGRFPWREKMSASVPVVFLLMTILPVLDPFGTMEIIFAERFGYGFRAGLTIMLSLVVARIYFKKLELFSRRIVFYAVMIFITSVPSLFYVFSLYRTIDWTTSYTLFSKDAARYPHNAKLHFNLGMSYAQSEQWKESEDEFSIAIELVPNFPEAHFRIGFALRKLGLVDDAQLHWKMADELGYKVEKTSRR